MKPLAAVNGHHFTEANGFTLVRMSWGSDPLFAHSKFLTKFCFFLLYHKSTERKTIITALLLVSFLIIQAGSFFSDF